MLLLHACYTLASTPGLPSIQCFIKYKLLAHMCKNGPNTTLNQTASTWPCKLGLFLEATCL